MRSFSLILILFSCSVSPNIDRNIFIYQVKYGEVQYESVKSLALVDKKVFFQHKDSLLMNYEVLSDHAIEINDNKLLSLLYTIDINALSAIKDYNQCQCGSITKNEYVIRIIMNNGQKREYVFPEVLSCKEDSPCSVFEKLSQYFKKYD